MRIQLAQYNSGGVCASIADDQDETSIRIFARRGRSISSRPTVKAGQAACLKAAEKLRKAAELFEKLAESDNPFSCDVQRKLGKV